MIQVVVADNIVSEVVRIMLSRVDVTEENMVVDVVVIGCVKMVVSKVIVVEKSEVVLVILDEVVLSALVVVRISVAVVEVIAADVLVVSTVASDVAELVGTVNPKVDDVVDGNCAVTVVICLLLVDSKAAVAVRVLELFAVGRVVSVRDDELRHSSGRVLFNTPHSNE